MSSTWSESDSDEDAYALLSAVTCSSISSTTRRSIGGTAVKKRKMGFDPTATNTDAKGRSCSLGDNASKPPDDPDITGYRASSLGAISTGGGGSTKSSRKPSLHLPSDGPPVLPPLNFWTTTSRRNSSLGSVSLGLYSSSSASRARRRSSSHRISDGPSSRPPNLNVVIPTTKGSTGIDVFGDMHSKKKRPRAFQPVSPREVYLRLYGDDGGSGGPPGGGGDGYCDDASGGVRTKFDDSSGVWGGGVGNSKFDGSGDRQMHVEKGGNHGPPLRIETRRGSAIGLRRKSKSKRGSDTSTPHPTTPPDKKPSSSPVTPGTATIVSRRRGSSKHSQKQHRKKSLQSCWFDDDDTTAEESDMDMDLDLLGPLSPPAFSKKKRMSGTRLTPSKRSVENINLFDPFFSFSRRCTTAPIRNIGPLDNWLSDSRNN
jgi:hypothetical protein